MEQYIKLRYLGFQCIRDSEHDHEFSRGGPSYGRFANCIIYVEIYNIHYSHNEHARYDFIRIRISYMTCFIPNRCSRERLHMACVLSIIGHEFYYSYKFGRIDVVKFLAYAIV